MTAEWRLEAAMDRMGGFPAARMRLESRSYDSWLPGGSHSNLDLIGIIFVIDR